jgi:hypothetical protein
MGITIHYHGGIDRLELISKFTVELEDIAQSMGWDSHLVGENESDPPFRGIIISPAGQCETLSFIFDRLGRLRNLADLVLEQVEPNEFSGYCFVKTQYAPIETHAWIIGLLRYLKKHYLSDLEVTDEGGFWETGDVVALSEKRQYLKGKIEQLAEGLASTDFEGNLQSPDDMIAHLEMIVRRFKENKFLNL